jgi:hypothetical protein
MAGTAKKSTLHAMAVSIAESHPLTVSLAREKRDAIYLKVFREISTESQSCILLECIKRL